MDKKIIVGSIIAIVVLLLMPSIPAIQKKTIEEREDSDFIEQLDFKDIKELVESGKLDRIKHPILYIILTSWLSFRAIRGIIIYYISSEPFAWGGVTANYPLLFYRGLWLAFTSYISFLFLQDLSNKYGWNWIIPL